MIKIIGLVFLEAVVMFLSGALITFLTYNENPQWVPSVRKIAVENGCGGYDHVSGSFSWEKVETPEQVLSITIPDIKPQRKPKH